MVTTAGKESALASLVPGLAVVEQRLQELFDPGEDTVAGMAAHVIGAGGKRLRPALVLSSAGGRAATTPDPALVDMAAAIELIHTASLIHDDIMDGAGRRRGVPTLHTMWGEHMSVLAGDYVFARSFSMLAAAGCQGAVEAVADSVQAMCGGQIDETIGLGDPDVTEAQYLHRIERKTARLLAAACRVGALHAGLEPPQVESLAAYGLNLGLAFQLADDLLDIDGDPAEMGKPAGSDIVHGVVTLPLIHVMSRPGSSWVRDHIADPGSLHAVLDVLRAGGGIEYTRGQVVGYTRRALKALDSVTDPGSRRILSRLARHLSQRGA